MEIHNKTFIIGQYYLSTCIFNITEHCLFPYDVLNIKKHIGSSVSDHIDNSCIQKKPIKKLLVLKWTKFHVKLRNFEYYGLIQVPYLKKREFA